MICVLGVLKTERGLKIKEEILNNLNMHNFLCIEQEPPGEMFEYPALNYAIKAAIDTNSPVLYLHTKGAFNSVPYQSTENGRKTIFDFMPKDASKEDWQKSVRKMWYNEFGKNVQKYLNAINENKPIVACPYSGPGKVTWQNGFIMNPLAAKELSKIFKFTTNRYWYEVMFNRLKNVEVKGIIRNDICYPMNDSRFEMYKSIWSFYNK